MNSEIPPSEWQQARLSRDPRFDGRFYIGVVTTGIFCRTTCPARLPKEENVRYLRSAMEAIDHGFRPCKRCRPEYAPNSPIGWSDERLAKSLRLVESGYLDGHKLAELATVVGLSERQLRRLYQEHLGCSPQQVADTQRLLKAKQLLCESNLAITDIAAIAGFNSIRRFNSKIKEFYRQSPSEIRKQKPLPFERASNSGVVRLDLPLSEHYPWQQVHKFYAQRTVDGMERSSANGLTRIHGSAGHHTLVSLHWHEDTKASDKPAIRVELYNALPQQIGAIIATVRRTLDLNSNPLAIRDHLAQDPLLQKALGGPQQLIVLPGAWDPFEYLIRAIIGQQVSVKAARTLTHRLVTHLGEKVELRGEQWQAFPTAENLSSANLASLGLTQRRIETIKAIASAQVRGDFDLHQPQDLEILRQQLLAIKGIGPWTVDYLMMRAYSQADIWLDTDLGVIKALNKLAQTNRTLSPATIKTLADDWSPWRSYAVMALWHYLSSSDL